MTCIVTKATPIQFIDSKCHKEMENCKTALSSYYTWLSHDLLLMPFGKDTPMFADETISRNQVCADLV